MFLTQTSLDSNADGQADAVINYTYDESGNQTGLFLDNDIDGTIDYSFTTDISTNASGIRTVTETSSNVTAGSSEIYISTFDSAGNLIEEAFGRNGAEAQTTATYAYNGSGQITAYDDNRSLTEYTYDASGRLSSTIVGTGSTTYIYDESGNLVQQVLDSPATNTSSTTTYTYDEADRLVESDTNGNVLGGLFGGSFSDRITYEYNAAGQIIAYEIFNDNSGRFSGFANTYEYDSAGNLIKERSVGTGLADRNSTEDTYEYNAVGQITAYLSTRTDPSGQVRGLRSTYEYDSAGQVTSQSTDENLDGIIDDVTSYEYDDLLTGGARSVAAVAIDSSSAIADNLLFEEPAQSVAFGAGDTFSGGELVNSFTLESSALSDVEASLIPADSFSI